MSESRDAFDERRPVERDTPDSRPEWAPPGMGGQAAPSYPGPSAVGPDHGPGAFAPPGYGGYQQSPRTNSLAIVSLVLSLLGLLLVFPAIAGVVCGHIARRQIRQRGEGGDGLAVAGLVVGYIIVAFLVLAVVFISIGVVVGPT